MGIFNSQKTIATTLTDITPILADVKAHFEENGFEVQTEENADGGFISITKGGLFKDLSGLKSALNTTLTVQQGSVTAEAKVGAFGKNALTMAGGLLLPYAWPLAITAAVGMITQSKLDEEMITEIEKAIHNHEQNSSFEPRGTQFCTNCGEKLPESAAFCPKCGRRV